MRSSAAQEFIFSSLLSACLLTKRKQNYTMQRLLFQQHKTKINNLRKLSGVLNRITMQRDSSHDLDSLDLREHRYRLSR